jgi:tRNA(Ile)-lysidine synthase TilS/MesJ
MKTKLCTKCILPANYVGLKLDESGLCNFCREEKEQQFLGKEKLIERVNNILSNHPERKYDCVVGFSGGRDSTYLLYFIVHELKLKPLAVFIDSGLIPEQTIQNVENIAKILHVDLKIVKHNFLKKCFKVHFNAWSKRPVPETLITLCVGCRLGIHLFVDEEAIKQSIPIIFSGNSPYEGKHYKSNIIKLNPNSKSKSSFILGYLKQIILNPFLILNPYSSIIQINEYYTTYFKQKKRLKHFGIQRISIYQTYIKWEEKVIENVLKNKLGWKKYPGLKTSYRGDCEVGIIRQFFYWKLLGYNDKDDHLSCLIRNNQITREEALKRIDDEHELPINILQNICFRTGIKFSKIDEIVN